MHLSGTYFFNVESLLFFFWSLMLFISVWEIENKVLKSQKFINGSKILCFVLPGLQVILTNIPPLKKVEALHLVIANCISEFDRIATRYLIGTSY